MQRPGFRLIYKEETSTHFIAMFNAGLNRLAFCKKQLVKSPSDTMAGSMSIRDTRGDDQIDSERKFEILKREFNLEAFRYIESDGELYPIKNGRQGVLRVVYRWGPHNPDGSSDLVTVVDADIPWGTNGD